jgi:hypothetical protein
MKHMMYDFDRGLAGTQGKRQRRIKNMSRSWTINYEPEEGGRYTGTLTVDDEKLKFTSLYDSSNTVIVKSIAGLLGSLVATGGNLAYVSDNDSELTITLPKSEIDSTTVKNSLFAKRVIVTMKNDQRFVFNYGVLSVTKLAQSIG